MSLANLDCYYARTCLNRSQHPSASKTPATLKPTDEKISMQNLFYRDSSQPPAEKGGQQTNCYVGSEVKAFGSVKPEKVVNINKTSIEEFRKVMPSFSDTVEMEGVSTSRSTALNAALRKLVQSEKCNLNYINKFALEEENQEELIEKMIDFIKKNPGLLNQLMKLREDALNDLNSPIYQSESGLNDFKDLIYKK